MAITIVDKYLCSNGILASDIIRRGQQIKSSRLDCNKPNFIDKAQASPCKETLKPLKKEEGYFGNLENYVRVKKKEKLFLGSKKLVLFKKLQKPHLKKIFG